MKVGQLQLVVEVGLVVARQVLVPPRFRRPQLRTSASLFFLFRLPRRQPVSFFILYKKGLVDDKEIEEEIVGLKIASTDRAPEDPQTEGTSSELEAEKLYIPGEEEISPENFEPLDVIEQSRETVEKLRSQDKSETDQVEETSEEYNLGYQDALNEFEKTLEAEKKAISNFGSTLLSIRDDASKIIEELIKEKLAEISNEFLGKQISDFPKDFLSHIENISASIVSNTNEIIVELNEIDAAALKTSIELEQLAFKIKEVTDLGRGEFKIIVGKSGYEQRIAD